MAIISVGSNLSLPYTLLSNKFIDNFMLSANPTYSVVYIYLIRMAGDKGCIPDTSEVAQKLNILESDVINAIKFWVGQGILEMDYIGDDISITFLEIPDNNSHGKSQKENKDEIEEISNGKINYIKSRPAYTKEEIDMYKSEEEARRIFDYAEKSLGKLLKYNELTILFSFYDWLRLPIEVIEKLIDYCVGNGKRHFNYMEAVAVDWTENGIDSVEKAEEYVKRFNNCYLEILRYFGATDRMPAEKEIAYMKRWIDDYKMPMEVIKEACAKTILNTGKISFHYAETVLSSWYKQGIHTMESIKLDDEQHEEKNKNKNKDNNNIKRQKVKKSSSVNKVINYTGREWDFDKLKELERGLLRK